MTELIGIFGSREQITDITEDYPSMAQPGKNTTNSKIVILVEGETLKSVLSCFLYFASEKNKRGQL